MVSSELADNLATVLAKYSDNSAAYANNFLKLSKPTPENLKKYAFLNLRWQNFILIFSLVRFPFTIIISFLINIIFSLSEFYSRDKQTTLIMNSDVLCISQITDAGKPLERDRLLGEIPIILASKHQVGMFYLNGTRTAQKRLEALYREYTSLEFCINSKFLQPKDTLSMFKKNTRFAIKLFVASIFEPKITTTQRIITANAAIYQCKRGTVANIVFITIFRRILLDANVKKIFFTMEGHAHEALLINLIKSEFPDIKLIAYQHAPLLESQFGFMQNVSLLRVLDSLTFSGETTARFISQSLKNCTQHVPEVRIIGTSKYREVASTKNLTNFFPNKFILLLPEGTKESLLLFLQTMSYLAKENPNLNFRLRPHPASNLNTKDLKNFMPKNALISKNMLEEDFEGAAVSIYRSSATALEGLNYGILPIHFNPNSHANLDPFSITKLNNPSANSVFELSKVIKKFYERNYLYEFPEFETLIRINREYFSKLDREGILSL